MKKYLSKIFLLLIIILWVFTHISETSLAVETADKNQATDERGGYSCQSRVFGKCFIGKVVG